MNSNFIIVCLNLVSFLQWTSADNEFNTWLNSARYLNLSNILDSPRVVGGVLNSSLPEKELTVLNFISGHNLMSHHRGECARHRQMVRDGVAQAEEWALRFLDASAKWTNGFMTGSLVQPGSYDDCLELSGPFMAFRGQHCLLDVDMAVPGLGFTAPVDPMVAMLQHSHNNGKRLSWAVCTPSTCASADVRDSVVAELNAAFPNNGSVGATVSHCRSYKEPSQFSTADYVAIFFFSFFGLVIVLSTAYDLLTITAEERYIVLTSFSFYSNGRVMLSPAVDVLPALHGVRVLTRIWDQMGKLYLAENLGPAVNSDILDKYYSDWGHVFITNPTFAIDSISFLSGCLVGFNFMKERALGIRFYLAHFYFKRYVRFTCPYAALLLMQSTLLIHLGSGPIWLEKVVPLQENCRESWYTGLIYLGNYILEDKQCFSQVWFNCAEMQMFWLSPLLLFPLWKRPLWGKALVVALVAAGLVITFLVAFVNEVPVGNMTPKGKGALVFLPTHTRYPSWIIGLLTGCLLQDAETNAETLTPAQVKLGWVVSMGLILMPVVGSHSFQQPDSEYNPYTHSAFISLTRPAFTIGLSFVVYACITGHGGPVNTILSWSFFRVTSRAMYSFYLTHTSVLFYLGALSRTPIYITDTTLLVLEVAYFFITWAFSTLLCLSFEMPFVIIEQYYLGKTGHPRPASRSRSVMMRPSLRSASALFMDRETGDDMAPTQSPRGAELPATPGASLNSIGNASTIVWQDSFGDLRALDASSTDHLLAVVRKRLAKPWVRSRQDLAEPSGSALQLQRPSSGTGFSRTGFSRTGFSRTGFSRTGFSRMRLSADEVEARRAAEASVRVGTDVEVLEQEDGHLKQLQRARSAVSAVKLRTRREDHERGTADLDVFQDYDEDRELAEEQYFRVHGVALSESDPYVTAPARSRSVVRFSVDADAAAGSSGIGLRSARASRTTRVSVGALPAFTDEPGPSGGSASVERERRLALEDEERRERERKRAEEELRMEERRKKEEKRWEEEYAVLIERKRIEEEREREEEMKRKEIEAEETRRKEDEETVEEDEDRTDEPGPSGGRASVERERRLALEDEERRERERKRAEEELRMEERRKKEEKRWEEEYAVLIERKRIEEEREREEEMKRKEIEAEETRRKEDEETVEEDEDRTDEPGPSGGRASVERERRLALEDEERRERERKRAEEELRMEERRKKEEKRWEEEYAVLIERKRIEEEREREEEMKRKVIEAEETRRKEEEETVEEDEDRRKKEEKQKTQDEEQERTKKDEESVKKTDEEKRVEKERDKMAEESERKAAELQAKKEEEKSKEEDRKRKSEEEQKKKDEENAKKADEEKRKAEAQERKAEEEKIRKEELQAKRDEEGKRKEEERKKKSEEEQKRKDEEKVKKIEEEKRKEEQRVKKAEEDKRKKNELQAKKDEEEKGKEEDRKKKTEEDQKRKDEEKVKKIEEEKRKEEERVRKAEEEKRKKNELQAKKDEEEKAKEEDRKKKTEEDQKRKDEEKVKTLEEEKRKEEERVRKADEEKRKKDELQAKKDEKEKRKEEDRNKKAEEDQKKKDEEKRKKDEEAAKREEERKKKEAERKRKEEAERNSGAGPSQSPDRDDPGGHRDGRDPGASTMHWRNAFRRL